MRTAAVDIGSRDDKSAEFRARIAVVTVKDIGTDFLSPSFGRYSRRPEVVRLIGV
jgi:hypothetical protein